MPGQMSPNGDVCLYLYNHHWWRIVIPYIVFDVQLYVILYVVLYSVLTVFSDHKSSRKDKMKTKNGLLKQIKQIISTQETFI